MIQIPEDLKTAFCYLGAATSCLWAASLAQSLYCYLRPSSLPRYNPSGKDSWALVTGATDGIGFGFAQELSRNGFNIFLHGRNREKLLKRQEELQAEFPNVKTKIIVIDVANLTEDVDLITQEIGDAHLTVLVNNVGGELKQYLQLTELTYQDVKNTIMLNVMFMAQVTRVLLPILEKNGPGLVLNISSIAAWGMPFVALYSGTKGFVDSFTRAIEAEVKANGKNVEVLGLRVGSVQSQGNDVDTTLFIPTSRNMAAAGLQRVGCGQPIVTGYFWHAIQNISFLVLPRSFLLDVTAKTMRSLRQAAEEKQAKKR
ncbi:hypothetical protein ASPWEDRAFT_39888 [Aspergillus wentii DTO 134E9]|uniref:Very-long-chain 3-oxoacyl-CoA reductase n=1 Tax=Aspergillus wentii DTO 134E9 TaxID=1073089 RepID=A0A1L9RIU7_ASPWE|nr:uncharacterized protein ASPWEDRAFT_39888 [Aspergillus wentii DTO 134E9]KAI9932237.1 hypothetical protein MW887_009747 [Aspergillus wentii]OJJ34803.1 hypothetical protein ASPWEDRAFT_39888 [Aspergillus wentii DTO 134E9]